MFPDDVVVPLARINLNLDCSHPIADQLIHTNLHLGSTSFL